MNSDHTRNTLACPFARFVPATGAYRLRVYAIGYRKNFENLNIRVVTKYDNSIDPTGDCPRIL